jgi:hypothetical protein
MLRVSMSRRLLLLIADAGAWNAFPVVAGASEAQG